jgi:hypothetical protein
VPKKKKKDTDFEFLLLHCLRKKALNHPILVHIENNEASCGHITQGTPKITEQILNRNNLKTQVKIPKILKIAMKNLFEFNFL